MHVLLANRGSACNGVQRRSTDTQRLDSTRLQCLSLAVNTSQHRVHTRHEFSSAKRFGHVIIRASGEATNQVLFRVASGKHDDRNGTLALNLSADLEPINTWEHEI